MNIDTTKRDWTDVKDKIKARFGKLTDESVDSVKENLDLLTGKLQTAYGYAKEQAEKEVKTFKASLHEATKPGDEKQAPTSPAPQKVA